MVENNNLEKLIPVYIERFKQRYDEFEEKTGRHGKKGSEIRKWLKEEVQSAFSKENIDSLEKEKAIDILSDSYSMAQGGSKHGSENQGNREWAEEIYEQNFVERVKDLLFGEEDIAERFVRFKEINGVNNGITSEILSYFYPDQYAIALSAPERALVFLGFNYEEVLLTGKNSGKKYIEYCEMVTQVRNLLRKDPFFEDANFVTTDYFLWGVGESEIWQVAPSHNKKLWSEKYWQNNDLICIGGDYWTPFIKNVKNSVFNEKHDELVALWMNQFPENSLQEAKNNVTRIEYFSKEMQPGDIILVNQGKKAIVGCGVVVSEAMLVSDTPHESCGLYRNIVWQNTEQNYFIPPVLQGRFSTTIQKFSFKDYKQLVNKKNLNPIVNRKRYWKISPGPAANQWGPAVKRGIIPVGWGDFSDFYSELSLLSDETKFSEKFEEIVKLNKERAAKSLPDYYNEDDSLNKTTVKNQLKMLYNFLINVQIGDYVVANKGTRKKGEKQRIIGIGKITSDYQYDPKLNEFPLYRDVEWKCTDLNIQKPDSISGKWTWTIAELAKTDFDTIVALANKPKVDKTMFGKLLKIKKQIILYGPPGTGKTYEAKKHLDAHSRKFIEIKRKTVENKFFWFTVNPKKWDPEKLFKDKETELSFGTHLKSAFADIEEGDLLFMYVSSPVKQMTAVAECSRIEESPEGKRRIFIRGLKPIEGLKWAEFKEDEVLSTSLAVRTGARGTLFPLTDAEGMYLLEQCHLKPEDLNQKSSIDTERIPNTRFVTFHPSFAYEDFIEGLRPEADEEGAIRYQVEDGVFKEFARQSFNALLTEAGIKKEWLEGKGVPKLNEDECSSALDAVHRVPFYLIIDEINRGDIARILGELITLLEADKRLCAENELTTLLPYSKTRFGIPPNLFVIGTMNTADKSIALVDIALRRRFGFIEMMPDSEVLRKLLVSADPEVQEIFDTAIAVLEQINEAILQKYDRDHQIGHSYFVKLKEETTQEGACEALEFIWYHEVLPLLQEYFYDSPKKLSEVLGKDFVTLKSEDRSFTFTEPCRGGVFIGALKKLAHLESPDLADEGDGEEEENITTPDE